MKSQITQATDTINDHTLAGRQVRLSTEVGKRFHEPIMTMATDGYEVRILTVYKFKIKYYE